MSGVEYSFAGGPDAGSGSGVMTQQPRATPAGGDWKFKQAIVLGTVAIPYQEFDKILQEVKDQFPANTYDLMHRNCNHFTTAVSKRLGLSASYPSWINRAASWGSVFSQTTSARHACRHRRLVHALLTLHRHLCLVSVLASTPRPAAPPKSHKPIELPPPKESIFKTTSARLLRGAPFRSEHTHSSISLP
jgi:hypothetical protein